MVLGNDMLATLTQIGFTLPLLESIQTLADISTKLNAAVNAVATDKTIIERFSALGFKTAPASPEALTKTPKPKPPNGPRTFATRRLSRIKVDECHGLKTDQNLFLKPISR